MWFRNVLVENVIKNWFMVALLYNIIEIFGLIRLKIYLKDKYLI